MKNSLSVDLSLDDPILPSSSSKARDMLLGKSHVYISDLQFLSRIYNSQVVPKKCYLNFDHPTMKSTYGSVSLHFEAVYSNVIILLAEVIKWNRLGVTIWIVFQNAVTVSCIAIS